MVRTIAGGCNFGSDLQVRMRKVWFGKKCKKAINVGERISYIGGEEAVVEGFDQEGRGVFNRPFLCKPTNVEP